MAARGSVGTGYIDIVPRLGSDWGRELTRRMQEGAGPAGDRSGQDAGQHFFSGFLARFRVGPFQAIGGTIGKGIAAGVAAAGGLGIGKLLADSVTNASDLSETVSKVNVVFGTAAAGVLKFGKTAASALGQSRQQALEATGTIGNLFVSMGLGSQKAADMSMSMVKLASDFASFNNASPEEALDAIKAALIGENDPIQRFGVLLNAASVQAEALRLGLIKGKEEVTPAIQAQAAYSLILAQSTTAQGDFARTSGGLANQQRILKARFQDLSANLGGVFLPVVTRVVSGFAGLVGAAPRIAGEIGGKLAPAFNTAKLGLSAFVAAAREGDVTSDGFVGAMERVGDSVHGAAVWFQQFLPHVRRVGEAVVSWLLPSFKNMAAFITQSVWPSVKNLAEIFVGTFLPAIRFVATVAGGVLLVAFRALSVLLKDVLGPALAAITGFWRDNQTTLAALAVAVGAGIAAWYAYKAAVAIVTTVQWIWTTRTLLMEAAVRAVRGGMVAMRVAVLALNTAFLANPIGLIIVGLVALAAGFAYAWRHSEAFRNFWKALWDGIKNVTMTAVNAVVGFVKRWWPLLIGLLTGGLGIAVVWVIRHWDGIKGAFSAAIDWVKNFVQKWWPFILGVMTGGVGLAVGMIIRHWDGIESAFSTAINWVKSFVSKWWPYILVTVLTGGLGLAVMAIVRHWDRIKSAFSGPIDWIKGVVSRGISAVSGAFEGGLHSMERVANAVWDRIKSAFSNPIDFIKGLISGFDHIVNNITGAIGLGRPLPERFARGGRLPGYGGGDRRLILAEDGEAVVPKHLVPEMAGWAKARGIPGFAGGGLLGAIGHAVTHPLDTIQGAGSWVLDKAAHLLREGAAAALSAALAGPRGLLHAFMDRALPWKMPATATDHGLTGIIDWIRGKESAGSGGAAGPAPAAAGPLVAYAKALLESRGWASQFGALNSLIMGESGWNVHATNPSSGAYGIPQALPPGKMVSAGADWRTSGYTQLRWMMGYLGNVYGDPANAYAKWLARSPHWYDVGGGKAWPSGSLGVNSSGETEYVWRGSQLRAGDSRDIHVHFHGGTFIGTDKARLGREMRTILKESLRGDGKADTANSL